MQFFKSGSISSKGTLERLAADPLKTSNTGQVRTSKQETSNCQCRLLPEPAMFCPFCITLSHTADKERWLVIAGEPSSACYWSASICFHQRIRHTVIKAYLYKRISATSLELCTQPLCRCKEQLENQPFINTGCFDRIGKL